MTQSPVTAVNNAPETQVRVVDWEAIEADFRAGIKTLRQMAADYGISHVAIKRHADKQSWTRNLEVKIQAKSDEIVNRHVASSLAKQPDNIVMIPSEAEVIDATAGMVATVRISQRKDIDRTKGLFYKLMQELEDATDHKSLADALMELVEGKDSGSGEGEDTSSRSNKLRQTFDRIMSMPGRISSAKQLVEILEKMVRLEREAWGIDKKEDTSPENAIAKFLGAMKRSTLPIVHEVGPDDSI